jgi:hypothetical protein
VDPKRMYDLFFLVQGLDMLINACLVESRQSLLCTSASAAQGLSAPLPARGDDESVGSSRGYQLADDGEGNVHEPHR